MPFLWTKLTTIAKLGLIEVVTVFFYRVMIKLSIHPVCQIKSDTPNGPFFSISRLPKLDISPVSSWYDCGRLFSYINVPLGELPPDWLANPITGDKAEIDLLPWWKISDFEEKTGDVKLIWEQSRMDWVIAFAQRARNGDQKALIRLNGWLTHWLTNNPCYLGTNWKCGQEA